MKNQNALGTCDCCQQVMLSNKVEWRGEQEQAKITDYSLELFNCLNFDSKKGGVCGATHVLRVPRAKSTPLSERAKFLTDLLKKAV